MSNSTPLRVPFEPIGYTTLAIVLSLLCRALFMAKWSPIEDPTKSLSFLIFWIMSVLPILYLSFRRWVEQSINSFMPQVFFSIVVSFAIQTALNAVTIGVGLFNVSSEALMPFVWAFPWLALTTVFRNAYATTRQCKKLLIVLVPLELIFHVLYLIFPTFFLAYFGVNASASILLGLVSLIYGIVAWRLYKTLSPV